MATSFWETAGAPVVQAGLGMFSAREAEKAGEEKLRRAGGPLFDTQMSVAGQALNRAGGLDPAAVARERFNQQQSILAPGYEQQMQSLQRQMRARGQGGIASFAPVPGTQATPGVPINPQLAALAAAQAGEKAKSAYGSLNEGEEQISRMLQRSGMLQSQALGARGTALRQLPPKAPGFLSQLAGAGTKLLGTPGGTQAVGKGLSSAYDWAKNILGGGGMFGNYSGGAEWSPFQKVDWSTELGD